MSKMSDLHIEMQEHFGNYVPTDAEIDHWYKQQTGILLQRQAPPAPVLEGLPTGPIMKLPKAEIHLSKQQKKVHKLILSYGDRYTSIKKIKSDEVISNRSISAVMSSLRQLGLVKCSKHSRHKKYRWWKAFPLDAPMNPPQENFNRWTGRNGTSRRNKDEIDADDIKTALEAPTLPEHFNQSTLTLVEPKKMEKNLFDEAKTEQIRRTKEDKVERSTSESDPFYKAFSAILDQLRTLQRIHESEMDDRKEDCKKIIDKLIDEKLA